MADKTGRAGDCYRLAAHRLVVGRESGKRVRGPVRSTAKGGRISPTPFGCWSPREPRLSNPHRYMMIVSYPIPLGLGPRGRYAIHGTDRAILHHAMMFSGRPEGKEFVRDCSARSRTLRISYPDRRCATLAIQSIRKLRVPGIRFRVEVAS